VTEPCFRAFFLLLGIPKKAYSGVFIAENAHRCGNPALHLQEKCFNHWLKRRLAAMTSINRKVMMGTYDIVADHPSRYGAKEYIRGEVFFGKYTCKRGGCRSGIDCDLLQP